MISRAAAFARARRGLPELGGVHDALDDVAEGFLNADGGLGGGLDEERVHARRERLALRDGHLPRVFLCERDNRRGGCGEMHV